MAAALRGVRHIIFVLRQGGARSDRLRQEVLEAPAWDLHRIWSTDWFRNPATGVEKAAPARRSGFAAKHGNLRRRWARLAERSQHLLMAIVGQAWGGA